MHNPRRTRLGWLAAAGGVPTANSPPTAGPVATDRCVVLQQVQLIRKRRASAMPILCLPNELSGSEL